MNKQIGFYDKVKLIETLQEVDTVAPEVVGVLIKSLKANVSLLNYFVQNFRNPVVIREFYKQGFFKELPTPIEEDDGITFRGWSEGVILLRLADQIPDIIKATVREVKTSNFRVYGLLLQAVIKLDIKLVKELWPKMIGWLNDCKWPYFPDEFKKLCQTFIENEMLSEVRLFFEVLLKPDNPPVQKTTNRYLKHDEAIGKLDCWHLNNDVKPLLNSIEDIPFLLSIEKLFEQYLVRSIDIECVASNSDFCKTSYWRSAIEDHEQDRHNDNQKDSLLIILRDTLEKVLHKEPDKIKDKVFKYLNHEYIIFKRLALHLIRLGKGHFLDIAFEQLSTPDILDELYIHHEIFLLLRDIYPLLQKGQKNKIFSIIKRGPREEKISEVVEWHKNNYSGKVDVKEYGNNYKNRWIINRLQMIKGSLIGSNRNYYDTLVNKYGENEHPDFTHYIGTGGHVSQKPPITIEEWNQKTAKQCVDLMITWQPKSEIDNYLERISPKGLADIFKQSLNERWEEFIPEFERLITQSVFPTYAYAILDHISEKIKESQKEEGKLEGICNIRSIGEIIGWSCDKWTRTQAPKEDLEYGYGNSVCTNSLMVLENLLIYLDKHKTDIGSNLFLKIKNIILNLCAHPDPEAKIDDPQDEKYATYKDPIMVSINHIRPMALRELLRYALCRSNILNLKEKKIRWEDAVKEKVTEMLINDKAFSVRSIFGECWRWLFYLDEEWATKYHKNIFPEDTSDEYFITAWDSYITHKYWIDDPGRDLMRPLYIKAIDNFLEGKLTHTNLDPANSLAEHLAGFYRFDIEDLRMDGTVDKANPLGYLFSLKPNELHSHLAWSMWRNCDKSEEIEEYKKIWEKAKALWGFRLRGVELEDRNKSFSKELTWFLHFLNIKKLNIDTSQVKDLLIKTIPSLGKGDNDQGLNELTKYLVEVSSDNIEFSIELLLKTLEVHGTGLYEGWYIRKNEIEKIIQNARYGDFAVRKTTIKIIHKLGEYGQHWAREYLDELRK
ncbi:MAG: hypothetical protein WBC22_16985 [Sedimentisphaerales bacterium]